MKMFIVGHGRHGKDTVAEIMSEDGLSFVSSSMFVAECCCRPWMEKLGITYDTLDECYADRHNYRQEWYEAIKDYSKDDQTRLAREIFSEHDLYVGCRDRKQFLASHKLSDLSIWVDACVRVPVSDPTCKILSGDCDIILDNNGTLDELRERVWRLMTALGF